MLVTAILLGILFSVFATQNTNTIPIYFGDYTLPGIPVYVAILVPLLIGSLLMFLINLLKDLSQKMTIHEQTDKIKDYKKDLAEATKRAHKLELENVKMKLKNGDTDEESF